jgi:hypothetical protein
MGEVFGGHGTLCRLHVVSMSVMRAWGALFQPTRNTRASGLLAHTTIIERYY